MRYIVYVNNGDSMIKYHEFSIKKNAILYAHLIGMVKNIPATVEDTNYNQLIYVNEVQRNENKRRLVINSVR